ncbi:hypothetical protein SLEP1_g21729 [Rubroshorea leprosula]|uniref:Uncharacterized protein n=1 Tax=Rubroshorea leprosula TaxID=152421 RepID=A0AAV5JFP5_9ROSI|nr:hypothetical protein SLEP1_g21729 [Rubroshorea leprosula]
MNFANPIAISHRQKDKLVMGGPSSRKSLLCLNLATAHFSHSQVINSMSDSTSLHLLGEFNSINTEQGDTEQ